MPLGIPDSWSTETLAGLDFDMILVTVDSHYINYKLNPKLKIIIIFKKNVSE